MNETFSTKSLEFLRDMDFPIYGPAEIEEAEKQELIKASFAYEANDSYEDPYLFLTPLGEYVKSILPEKIEKGFQICIQLTFA